MTKSLIILVKRPSGLSLSSELEPNQGLGTGVQKTTTYVRKDRHDAGSLSTTTCSRQPSTARELLLLHVMIQREESRSL